MLEFVAVHFLVIAIVFTIGVAIGLSVVIWRYFFPISWHMWHLKGSLSYQKDEEALSKIGAPAVPALIKASTSYVHPIQHSAEKALQEITDPNAVEQLIAALRHQKEAVRLAAAMALTNIGDPRTQPITECFLHKPANSTLRQLTEEEINKIKWSVGNNQSFRINLWETIPQIENTSENNDYSDFDWRPGGIGTGC